MINTKFHEHLLYCLLLFCIILTFEQVSSFSFVKSSTCLSVKQLRLCPSSSFYLKANTVEEGDRVLLLVHITELLHYISGPGLRRTHKIRKRFRL